MVSLIISCIGLMGWKRLQAQKAQTSGEHKFNTEHEETINKCKQTHSLGLSWGVCENIGPRDSMEDAHCVKSSSELFYASVFDGHGGSSSSDFLRLNMYNFLLSELAQNKKKLDRDCSFEEMNSNASDIADIMNRAFSSADGELIDHIATLGDPECWSGSTATVCTVSRTLIICSNVGDSKAVLCRKSKTIELSNDHRPISSSASGRSEIKRVHESGAWISQSRVCGMLAVSRALGDYEFKGGRFELLDELRSTEDKYAMKASLENPPVISIPHVSTTLRSQYDEFIVIATDGLWDTMNSTQAITFVRTELKNKPSITMQAVAEALVQRALRCRTQDNVACVVIDLRSA